MFENDKESEQKRPMKVNGPFYIVRQVVLSEALIGTGSNDIGLSRLQDIINSYVPKGYRLHTMTTTSSGSKGFLGGDKIQATLVFERYDVR